MSYVRIHGDKLVASNLQSLRLYDISTSPPRLQKTLAVPSAQNPFSNDPNGERLSDFCAGHIARSLTPLGQPDHWTSQSSSVGIYDTDLNEMKMLSVGRRLDDRSLVLSPDAKRLASISYGNGVVILDANTGEIIQSYKGSIGSGVSWSPDGRWIAAGDTDQGGGALYLIDTLAAPDTARVLLPKPTSKAPLYDSPFHSAFSADSLRVAFSSTAWGKRGLSVYDVTTAAEVWSKAFRVVSEDEDSDEEEEHWQTLDVAFAVSGRVVLMGLESSEVRAYRTADGHRLGDLFCGDASGPFFAPDDVRRCVWFMRDGEPARVDYPEDWV